MVRGIYDANAADESILGALMRLERPPGPLVSKNWTQNVFVA